MKRSFGFQRMKADATPTTPFKQGFYKIAVTLPFILITILVLGYLLYRQRDVLVEHVWEIRPLPLVIAFILYSLTLFQASVNWGWILNTLGNKTGYLTHLQHYMISNLTKRLPGTLWYIAGRGFLYQDQGIAFRLVTLASGIEHALIFMASILISYLFSIKILVAYHISPILLGAAFLLLLAVLVHPKFVAWLFQLLKLEVPQISIYVFFGWLFSYALQWIIGGLCCFAIASTIYDLPIQQIGYVIGSWAVVGLISSMFLVLPSNLGVTEIGLSLLLSNMMPSSIAVVVVVLQRVLFTLFDVVWASLWSSFRMLSKRD